MDYTFLQEYWWLLISILGAVLVFLLFVQGAQSMFLQPMSESQREKMVEGVAHRWELTFTTLVVFGGAFFASFPLFYSTSFGGAYWVWMLILFGFVVQAVSYKYRNAEGNLLGRKNIYGYRGGKPITNGSDRFLYIGIFVSLKSNKAYDIANF